MTGLELIAVIAIVEASWVGMFLALRGTRTPRQIAIVLICVVIMLAGFALGSYLNHDDFTCKAGQHCFPWGN